MSVLEKDIEQTVVDWAKAHGFLALKVTFTENGYPDRLFISPHGHTVFIEFKRPGEKPRALQSHRIADLVAHGIVATWTCSAVEAINMLRTCLEPSSVSSSSDKTAAEPSLSGVVLGSRTWQDIDRVGRPTTTTFQRTGEAGSYYSTVTTDVQHVAERNKEMGGLQLDLFPNPTRDPEGDGPDYGRADSLD